MRIQLAFAALAALWSSNAFAQKAEAAINPTQTLPPELAALSDNDPRWTAEWWLPRRQDKDHPVWSAAWWDTCGKYNICSVSPERLEGLSTLFEDWIRLEACYPSGVGLGTMPKFVRLKHNGNLRREQDKLNPTYVYTCTPKGVMVETTSPHEEVVLPIGEAFARAQLQ